MRKPRFNKPHRELATKAVADMLVFIGANKTDAIMYPWEIETEGGKLGISFSCSEGLFCFHCRFDDVERAWKRLHGDRPKSLDGYINPYSGKYNTYVSPPEPGVTPKATAEEVALVCRLHIERAGVINDTHS